MKLLLTGFEPFDGQTVNPSWEAVCRLSDRVGGVEIVRALIPTAFSGSAQALARAVEREDPQAVLCLGQAGGREGLTPERVAITVDDARIPDNAGAQPIDRPIVPDGPAAYFATLPVKAMVRAIREAGVPANLSNTAGTFVCNHLMYCLMHLLAGRPGVRGGFMHVPFLPEQGSPSLPLEDMVRGLAAAVEAIGRYPAGDAREEGGALC